MNLLELFNDLSDEDKERFVISIMAEINKLSQKNLKNRKEPFIYRNRDDLVVNVGDKKYRFDNEGLEVINTSSKIHWKIKEKERKLYFFL